VKTPLTKTIMSKLLGKPRPLDSRNRVTLPPELLDLLKLKPNDEIFFKIEDGKIILGKALVKYELIDEIITDKKK
jgi:bifunctional DNA-binding transcriptional regulator/antitoxin component of YhaV-PrlF toxin-antitoxin module